MKFKNIISPISRWGLRRGLYELAIRFVNKFVLYDHFICLELDASKGAPMSEKSALRNFEVTSEQLKKVLELPEYEMTEVFVELVMSRRYRCFGAWEGDVLAAYVFISQEPTIIKSAILYRFSPKEVYVFKALTLPRFRGKRAMGSLLSYALQTLMTEGKTIFSSWVLSHNFPSLNSFMHLGFRVAGSYRALGNPVKLLTCTREDLTQKGRCVENI